MRNPSLGDGVDTTARHIAQIRQLRLRQTGHTEIKNHLVEGAVTTDRTLLPWFVGRNVHNAVPEWKALKGYRAILLAGTCSLSLTVNTVEVATLDVTTVAASVDLDELLEVQDDDVIQAVLTDASGAASDLTIATIFVAVAG